jgi:RNA polymerase sigma factor (sigma-70 family)
MHDLQNSIQADASLSDLLGRYASGIKEEESFRALVNRLSGLIYQSSLRRCGQAEIAREVTQSIFVIMARKAKSLSKHSCLLAWVHRTTKFETVQLLRSQHRRRIREEIAMAGAEMMMEDSSQREILEVVDRSLDHLSRSERELVLMKYFEGRTYEAIVAKTGRSVSAEKMRLKRALQKMAIWINTKGGESKILVSIVDPSKVPLPKGAMLSVTALGVLLSSEMAKGAPAQVVASALASGQAGGLAMSSSGSFFNDPVKFLQTADPLKVIGVTSAILGLMTAVPAISMMKEIRELKSQGMAAHEDDRDGSSLRVSRRSPSSVIDDLFSVDASEYSLEELGRELAHALKADDHLSLLRLDQILGEMNPAELQELGITVSRSRFELNSEIQVMMKIGTYLPEDSSFEERILFAVSINAYSARNLSYLFNDWLTEDADGAIAWLKKTSGTSAIQGAGLRDDYESIFWSSALREIAKRSPEEAVAMVDELTPFESKRVHWSLSKSIPSRDLDLAIQVAKECPREFRDGWISEIMQQNEPRKHFETIGAWMKNKGFAEDAIKVGLRETLSKYVLSREGMTLEGALQWIENNSPVSDWESLVSADLLKIFSNQEGGDRQWIEGKPPGKARDAMLANAVGGLLSNDWSTLENLEKISYYLSNIGDAEVRNRKARVIEIYSGSESKATQEEVKVRFGAYLDNKGGSQ